MLATSVLARRLGGLAAAALVLFLAASAARAQSILSEPPKLSVPLGEALSGPPSSSPGGGQWESAPLTELFDQMAQGNGRAVYGALRARFLAEMIRAAAEGRDLDALRKRYLLALLRAGEGLAPPAEQEKTARQFTEYYPDDESFPLAFFLLNQARFQQNKPLEDSFFFDQAALESLPDWMQSRYLRMEAQSAERSGAFAEAAGFLLLEKEGRSTLHQTREAEVVDMLERLGKPAELSAFYDRHPGIDWLAERRPFLEARVLFNAGETSRTLLKLEELQSAGQIRTTADQKFVSDLMADIKARIATRPRRIGVLLPLSSSSSFLRKLARETLDGLRLAVQFPDRKEGPRAKLGRLLSEDLPAALETDRPAQARRQRPYELFIRDTGNNPKVAAQMVDSLVQEDDVIAIIGPIARDESEAAAARAEELGVPLISLSVSLDIPPDAHFIFRHSKSQKEEVRDLVRYAMDYLQARRFAILYPDDSYGHSMMELFWDDATKRGGKIVAAAPFTTARQRAAHSGREAVGLNEIFGQFTGLNRYVSPQDKALQDLVGDSRPDPIVDFDALFIPIGPAGISDLQLIAPYPITVDAEGKLLLGSRFWNDDAVLVAGDGKLEGAVFVDAYDRSSSNPKVVAFQTRHRAFFGYRPDYRPPSYYTGLGYDTANLLMSLLAAPGNHTRKALSDALHTMQPYFGVTGWTSFTATGDAEKESMFFRIHGNEILRVVP